MAAINIYFLHFFTLILLARAKLNNNLINTPSDHHHHDDSQLSLINRKCLSENWPPTPPHPPLTAASKRYRFIEESAAKRTTSKKKTISGWIFGIVSGIFAGGLFGMLFSVIYKFRFLMVNGGRRGEKDTAAGLGLTIFSRTFIKNPRELLDFLENDDELATLEMIGSGGCGEVYKAELAGKLIAIKKITYRDDAEEEDGRKKRQTRSEIQTVGEIRHRNLLPLLAHMAKSDCDYLVFEFMEEGSLNGALRQNNPILDWLARHKIAMGIAAGLEYLHRNNTQTILHRDLKPENVLLDHEKEAKITDFGLARAIPNTDTHLIASGPDWTIGYVAPEYSRTLKFTEKCDVFSFGMILAALVTGKLPTDEFFRHVEVPALWLRNVLNSEEPRRAIDPRLIGNGYEEQMLSVLKIASSCTDDDPNRRPNSKDVRRQLSEI